MRFRLGISQASKNCLTLLTLIAASDRVNLVAYGMTFKPLWLLIPIFYFFHNPSIPKKTHLTIILLFFLAHLLCLLVSGFTVSGLAYSLQIPIFYILFLKMAFDLCSNIEIDQVRRVIKMSARIQIGCAIMLQIFGFDERATFLYYEPSYMAIALIPYTCIALIGQRILIQDCLWITLFATFSGSANYVLIVLLVMIFVVGFKAKTFRGLLIYGLYSSAIILFVVLMAAILENTNAQFIDSLMRVHDFDSLLDVLIARTGNRIPRLDLAYQTAISNFFLGIGPGKYIEFSSVVFSDKYNVQWLSPDGLPPINIFLESIINAGSFGFLILVLSLCLLIRSSSQIIDKVVRWNIIGFLVVTLLVLQLESSYLRPYVWVYLGVMLAIARKSRYEKNQNIN